MINIEIGDKEYKVREAKTEEEKQKGLQGIKELPKDEGMLFYFDKPGEYTFWMKNTDIPLDIIFINSDEEVTKVYKANPNDETLVSSPDTLYVLEVNQDSGVKEGDDFDIEDEPVMKVLAQDGSTQMNLWGGERIISRRETRILVKKAKKAEQSKDDKDYKALGRYIFKVLKNQDNRPNEYVDNSK